MDLGEYPRPKDDTGIGVHWSAGFAAVVGLGQVRSYWVPELQAMGVKWVKIANHDGALSFAELLLEHDIMPVVRLYRPQPNPGVLEAGQLAAVADYVKAGVRYFEFNNEPDQGMEWQGGEVPPDAPAIVARNAVVDMEAILERGGYPAVPALAPGTRWDLVGEICRQGRRDLFAEPVWQAVHNYCINHPLDYPDDAGNQRGAPYPVEYYNRLAAETVDAWQGWTLDQVNTLRQSNANPGATIVDDATCWRAFERYDHLIRKQIGRSLPILATEGGYIVGERFDPRYAATTPMLHAEATVESCRAMMGTAKSASHAPDYFFCTAFWILGNFVLGHYASQWENAAWYSLSRPDGRLPVVAALKAEPKRVRTWTAARVEIPGVVKGTISGGDGVTVRLARPDGWIETLRADTAGQYRFAGVPPGSYTLTIKEASTSRAVTVSVESPQQTVDFDVKNVTLEFADSVITGKVRAGAGRTVYLQRSGSGPVVEQKAALDGTFVFTDLGRGSYTVSLTVMAPARSTPTFSVFRRAVRLAGRPYGRQSVSDIQLTGRDQAQVRLAAPGWGWTAQDAGPGPGLVLCRVARTPGLIVRASIPGNPALVQTTGSKPGRDNASDVCEFGPLSAGAWTIAPDSLFVSAALDLDGSRIVWLEFSNPAAQPPDESAIFGTVVYGADQTVILTRDGKEMSRAVLGDDRIYRFERLEPGTYRVEVPDTGAYRDGIALDGENSVQVDLQLPEPPPPWKWSVEVDGEAPGMAVVRCSVDAEPGLAVRLWQNGWEGMVQVTGSKPEYGPTACEFAPLKPGAYLLEPEGLYTRARVEVVRDRVTWVRFAPPAPLPPKSLDHYLLVGIDAPDRATLRALLQYVSRFSPAVGDDANAACTARHITIVGESAAVSEGIERDLRSSGCQVHRITGEYAQALRRLLAEGRPY